MTQAEFFLSCFWLGAWLAYQVVIFAGLHLNFWPGTKIGCGWI